MPKQCHISTDGELDAPLVLTFEETPRVGERIAIPDPQGEGSNLCQVVDVLHVPDEVENDMPPFTVLQVREEERPEGEQ